MKVYNRYTSQQIGSVRETGFGELSGFLQKDGLKGKQEPEKIASSLSRALESLSGSLPGILSAETGNTITSCRDEILASRKLADSFSSIAWNQHALNSTFAYAGSHRLSTAREGTAGGTVLAILSGVNPVYRFTEIMIASLLTGSRAIIRPSTAGALSIRNIWKEIESVVSDSAFIATFSAGSQTLTKLLKAEYISTVIFQGRSENRLSVRKRMHSAESFEPTDTRSYSLIWSDADNDSASLSATRLALSGLKHPGFTPHRVLVHQDSLQYVSNRIAEEAMALKAGNPDDPSTDIPSFLSAEDVTSFMNSVEDEKKNWGEQLTTPFVYSTSVGPAVLRISENPGKLWTQGQTGPFILIRPVKSLAEAGELIKNDGRARSLYVYTSDMNVTNYLRQNTRVGNLIIDPPPSISLYELFSIQGGLESAVSAMTQERKIVYWS